MIETDTTVSLEHFKAILDELPVGVLMCEPSGLIIYANRFLFKIDPACILGKNISELPSLVQISSQVRECLRTGRESTWEGLRYSGSDEKEVHLTARSSPFGYDGRIVGSISWIADTTDKVMLEEKLENKTRRFEVMSELGRSLRGTLKLEEVLKIIMIAITAGEGLGFNRTSLLLLDQQAAYLEGKMAMGPANREEAGRIWSYISQVKPSFRQLLQNYEHSIENQDAWVNHLVKKIRISTQDRENVLIRIMESQSSMVIHSSSEQHGSSKTLCELLGTESLAAVPLVAKEKPIGIILADNSISGKPIEREKVEFLEILAYHATSATESAKLYEKLASQVAEFEKANLRLKENSERLVRVEKLSVMGEITSQVAHEIRNPIAIIGGFANSILKKLDQNDANHEYIKIISQESQRIENILNNVLNFTRPERVHWEEANLNEIVEQTLDMLESEVEKGKIWVRKELPGGLPLVVVNPDQIRHALINIFRNAICAMPQGGTLSVTTQMCGQCIKISIGDTGTGIPKDDLNSIFKAFYTTKPDSNGLGLTVACEIIKNHGGSIGVESEEGKGTTFYIEFSLKKED